MTDPGPPGQRHRMANAEQLTSLPERAISGTKKLKVGAPLESSGSVASSSGVSSCDCR